MSGPTSSWEANVDVVVIGSGVAGLTAALETATAGLETLVVTKDAIEASNTRWAQGGIAVVLSEGVRASTHNDAPDSIERHVCDTLAAGGEMCDPDVTRSIIAGGPDAVRALIQHGARFDTVDGPDSPSDHRDWDVYRPTHRHALARTREGGHSAFRVIHAGGDATGAEVERALAGAARARERSSGSGLTVLERHAAVQLHRDFDGVCGLSVLADDGAMGVIGASTVVLATGGLGQLYQATTNPEVATADGIALALRAGATVTDLEFVQFHPTVLFTDAATTGRRPLVTEAVRGEGAVLLDGAGERIMTGVHPAEDLAPRDVVSAAITRRLLENPGGVSDRAFLDATHLSSDKFADRFPTVHAACLAAGVDPARQPIPIAPAAHFGCGGVLTDSHGRTEVPGLYAVGEVARTGLHGANRLASNSLLEGLVMGARAARAVDQARRTGGNRVTEAPGSPKLPVLPCPDRATLQRLMSRHAGIGRDADGLVRIMATLGSQETSVVPRQVASRADVEDAALGLTAAVAVRSASARAESRGCHVRTDYPAPDPRWQRSILVRLDESGTPTIHEAFDDARPGPWRYRVEHGEPA